MTKRLILGDVFEVHLDGSIKRYFQYVADDATQLGSQVVRVFKKPCDLIGEPIMSDVLLGGVDFYAHVFLALGAKLGYWKRIGNEAFEGVERVLFRNTNDYGKPEVKVSKDWYVWSVGGDFEDVGDIRAKGVDAEIGIVVPPDSLIYRMRHGKYDFIYPDY
jgi:hypothetical protein